MSKTNKICVCGGKLFPVAGGFIPNTDEHWWSIHCLSCKARGPNGTSSRSAWAKYRKYIKDIAAQPFKDSNWK